MVEFVRCFGTALRAGGALPLYPAGLTLVMSFPRHCGGFAPNTPGPFGAHTGPSQAKPFWKKLSRAAQGYPG
ncbi:MAG: hypothetical protein ACR2IK_19915 [Chloroflexota bacterium]